MKLMVLISVLTIDQLDSRRIWPPTLARERRT
jgi:hypothetical protein